MSCVLACIRFIVPAEMDPAFLTAYNEMAAEQNRPAGLSRSELLRGSDRNGAIQSLWDPTTAIMATRRQGNAPAAIALLDYLGIQHSYELWTVENASPGDA